MKHFSGFLFLISFLCCSFLMRAQFDENKFDKEYFLLGTLNEYMGYQRTFTPADDFYYQRVDILNAKELNLCVFIDSLFSADYPDIRIENNGASMGLKIYSPSLSQKLDDFFDYKPGGMYTGKMDTVYFGTMKPEIVVNEKQIRSFLLGAWLRYGLSAEHTNILIHLLKTEKRIETDKEFHTGIQAFSMSNASSKAKLCKVLLEKLGCKNVEYYYRESIPAGHFVLFTPNQKIKKVIKSAELLRAHIESIPTAHIKFSPDGDKFIWKETK